MTQSYQPLSVSACQQARLSRDPRFDGRFFIAVKTTGIFCRTICPAPAPKEQNVSYFDTAISALAAGFRPCLRCRPDSAPFSNPWNGVKTSLERAIHLIDSGALNQDGADLETLAQRLGITSRYLRKLFNEHIGVSPKQYSLYRQLLFAKQLLHQTRLPISDVAFAAGFQSVRSFNHRFKVQLQLTPTQVRRDSGVVAADIQDQGISLFLAYRPPFNWQLMRRFLAHRLVEGMEWLPDEHSYGRSFDFKGVRGYFVLTHQQQRSRFKLQLCLEDALAITQLYSVVQHIRKMFDLDANMEVIESTLNDAVDDRIAITQGLRLATTATVFEAACRAVLGQQVSIQQATALLNTLVNHYGNTILCGGKEVLLFPSATAIAEGSLQQLKMPNARRESLRALALSVSQGSSIDSWHQIKGIGPWTMNYIAMRGQANSDVLLTGDLVVKNTACRYLFAEQPTPKELAARFTALKSTVSPWGSYMTLQLWHCSLEQDKEPD